MYVQVCQQHHEAVMRLTQWYIGLKRLPRHGGLAGQFAKSQTAILFWEGK